MMNRKALSLVCGLLLIFLVSCQTSGRASFQFDASTANSLKEFFEIEPEKLMQVHKGDALFVTEVVSMSGLLGALEQELVENIADIMDPTLGNNLAIVWHAADGGQNSVFEDLQSYVTPRLPTPGAGEVFFVLVKPDATHRYVLVYGADSPSIVSAAEWLIDLATAGGSVLPANPFANDAVVYRSDGGVDSVTCMGTTADCFSGSNQDVPGITISATRTVPGSFSSGVAGTISIDFTFSGGVPDAIQILEEGLPSGSSIPVSNPAGKGTLSGSSYSAALLNVPGITVDYGSAGGTFTYDLAIVQDGTVSGKILWSEDGKTTSEVVILDSSGGSSSTLSLAGQTGGASCGNGDIESGEECDDGNTADGDGCSAFCLNEVPTPVCGDTICDVGEDDSNCPTDCASLVVCTDGDGDGYGTGDTSTCSYSAVDCDDNNPAVNPGASESDGQIPNVCTDGLDNDCDGSSDTVDSACSACVDADGDDYGASGGINCPITGESDCDDNNPAVNPGELEVNGNTVDENCDGDIGVTDNDGDGDSVDSDCDDRNREIFNGQIEDCTNAVDDNCDGLVDAEDTVTCAPIQEAIPEHSVSKQISDVRARELEIKNAVVLLGDSGEDRAPASSVAGLQRLTKVGVVIDSSQDEVCRVIDALDPDADRVQVVGGACSNGATGFFRNEFPMSQGQAHADCHTSIAAGNAFVRAGVRTMCGRDISYLVIEGGTYTDTKTAIQTLLMSSSLTADQKADLDIQSNFIDPLLRSGAGVSIRRGNALKVDDPSDVVVTPLT